MRFAAPTQARVAIAQFVTSLFGHVGVGAILALELNPVETRTRVFPAAAATMKGRWRASGDRGAT